MLRRFSKSASACKFNKFGKAAKKGELEVVEIWWEICDWKLENVSECSFYEILRLSIKRVSKLLFEKKRDNL